ncbi:bifunctional methylenetetrahydrofolate dehydrogenase/methenyltetrahydrofolate cyclohydrolase [Candidatus Uhrbacteria bacterium CG_4_10_14_0_8_um_filter_58_22]|uniref:Bifunctional protein FolD n=1 Tax=Candidatus Uhrbacteria bacterium CG_4_10_14_0_8_um_filter_58_22 TaxID=1975029 RepID=A0A2M7QC01_9BACT|nr:MAG: hypothetical protein AUJ19_04285 [Parcubacteria group bacterium CG1_02_58_44]PIY63311.1 MAG: bifunctional methylenetetrahydrofolate dehydrogenase/methenyltetrahydrofolate cyclohydrolase [Candidatus Uhrbacteria bacterium CG_4_10_14_0_8_um_filter_58_22]
MSARIIDGRAVARRILAETRSEIESIDMTPGLGVIMVGDDPASKVYVRKKMEAAKRIGVHFESLVFPQDTDEETIVRAVTEMNARDDIHGIVVQLPLPKGLDTDRIVRTIDPDKDVDGFHPELIRRMSQDPDCRLPGLVEGLKLLFDETGLELNGQRTVIISNSEVFSHPLKLFLERQGAGVETVRGDSPNLASALGQADLLITAVGRPGLVTGQMLKPGTVILDVGTTRVDGRVVGDVEFETASEVAGWITPVPGGVGPVTVAMLLHNVARLAKTKRRRITKNKPNAAARHRIGD